jgi:ribosomal protein S18 acetylase RimI-like enzyme
MQATFPKEREHLTPRDEFSAWRLQNMQERLTADNALYYKVVPASDPGRLAGFMGLYRPGFFAKSEKVEESEQPRTPPACVDNDVDAEYRTRSELHRVKIWCDNTDFWFLGSLIVEPEYQRQGLGKLMMQECLRVVDAGGDAAPLYLEATPEGTPWYPQFGFERVGEFSILEGKHVVTTFVRRATSGAADKKVEFGKGT